MDRLTSPTCMYSVLRDGYMKVEALFRKSQPWIKVERYVYFYKGFSLSLSFISYYYIRPFYSSVSYYFIVSFPLFFSFSLVSISLLRINSEHTPRTRSFSANYIENLIPPLINGWGNNNDEGGVIWEVSCSWKKKRNFDKIGFVLSGRGAQG